jgi:hypothetical protein
LLLILRVAGREGRALIGRWLLLGILLVSSRGLELAPSTGGSRLSRRRRGWLGFLSYAGQGSDKR